MVEKWMHILALQWVFCNALLITVANAHCLMDATSCCQCITQPGCSWFHGPAETRPFCSISPFIPAAGGNSTYDPNFFYPNLAHKLVIPRSKNKPINQHRQRIFRPQGAEVYIALGLRYEMPFEVLSRSRKLHLLVKGPQGSPEFDVEVADESSCLEGFRRHGSGPTRDVAMSDGSAYENRRRLRWTRSIVRSRNNRDRSLGGRGGSRGREGRRGNGGRERPRGQPTKRQMYDCEGSAPGMLHSFRLVLDMNTCLSSSKVINVGVRGAGKRLRVDVSSLCTCPCENGPTGSNEPDQAGIHGDERNDCDDDDDCDNDAQDSGSQGRGQCQGEGTVCETSEFVSAQCTEINAMCKASETAPTCSARGMCKCGACMCYGNYYGMFCECSNTGCPQHGYQMCGGEERGVCTCGKCVCREGYAGKACEHRMLTGEECVDPDSGLVCKGRGRCDAGRCVCVQPYSGLYCQECPTCPSRCPTFRQCVECLVSGQGAGCHELCSIHEGVQYEATAEVPHAGRSCVYQLPDGCIMHYNYEDMDDERTVVHYESTAACTESNPDFLRRHPH